MTRFVYPAIAEARGYRYWFRFSNIWAARQRFARLDYSNEWRYSFGDLENPDRTLSLSELLRTGAARKTRIIILGDTGEGDRSQYGLVPLLRALAPDLIIINGDVAYPAGRGGTWRKDENDFLHGFFEPYSGFGIPVWATPGNHEYYSPNNAREFYDVFCTRRFDRHWGEHGLRHAHLQPGMYWELDDLANSGLVLLGLDTGKDGNLDGQNDRWQFWKRRIAADERQLHWLEGRLQRIQQHPHGRAVVMFHIPALTRERQVVSTLARLHAIIARFPCIRLVLCAHDHNHQQYSPETFRRYLGTVTGPLDPAVQPHYIVNGGGGGYLESTMYPRGAYPGVRFPSADEWRLISTRPRQVVGRISHDKGVLSRMMGIVAKDVFMDYDEPVFLSCIMLDIAVPNSPFTVNRIAQSRVTVKNQNPSTAKGELRIGRDTTRIKASIRVTPVFLRALSHLYPSGKHGLTVHVQEGTPPPDREMVRRCLQDRDDPATMQQDLRLEI